MSDEKHNTVVFDFRSPTGSYRHFPFLQDLNTLRRKQKRPQVILAATWPDRLASVGLDYFSRFGAQLARIDKHKVGRTWPGPALTLAEIPGMVSVASGLRSHFLLKIHRSPGAVAGDSRRLVLDHPRY